MKKEQFNLSTFKFSLIEYVNILKLEETLKTYPIAHYTLTNMMGDLLEDVDELIPACLRQELFANSKKVITRYKKELETYIKEYLCQEQQ